VIELIKEFEAEYGFIDYEGDKFWFQTDLDAPKSRVIAIDINTGNQTEIISEAEETLQGVGLLNNQFVTSYLKDAYTQIKIFNLDGSFIKAVELPGIGSAGGFSGKRHDTETFYSYTSFTTPNNIYRYNMVTGESTLYRQAEVDFNPDDFDQ
jgi:prolyl oligopeptidase